MQKENSSLLRSVAVQEIVSELEKAHAEFNAVKESEVGEEKHKKLEAEFLQKTSVLEKQLVALPASTASALLVKTSHILKDRIEDYAERREFDWQRESMVSLLNDLQAYLIRQSDKESARPRQLPPAEMEERAQRQRDYAKRHMDCETIVYELYALAELWDSYAGDENNIRFYLLNNFADTSLKLFKTYRGEAEGQKPEEIKEAA
ncbi:MAG: hypothetical protein EOM12_10170 [Verrucomicrobiae bacterium]|nr:hypothetical protein [Verrucomicrobiae bacterium]